MLSDFYGVPALVKYQVTLKRKTSQLRVRVDLEKVDGVPSESLKYNIQEHQDSYLVMEEMNWYQNDRGMSSHLIII